MKATPEYGHVQARSANFTQYNAILTETEIGDAWAFVGRRWRARLLLQGIQTTHD